MICERGPWYVLRTSDSVVVASRDFTHDVWLYVTGDFKDTPEKLEYAQEIARRLNECQPES